MKRKHWYKIHSILGLSTGLLLLIIGLSGSLLVFGREIDQVLFSDRMAVEVSGPRKSFEVLRKRLDIELPDYKITGWEVQHSGTQPDIIWMEPQKKDPADPNAFYVSLLNPYTGQILGSIDTTLPESVYGLMLAVHTTLLAGLPGYFLIGLIGILFCLSSLTGLYIYRSIWKNKFRLRVNQGRRTLLSDLHKLTGLAVIWFNLLAGFTGAWWVIENTIFHDHEQPDKTKIQADGSFYNRKLSFDTLSAKARNEIPGFRLGYFSVPHEHPGEQFKFYGSDDWQNSWRSRYGSVISFDPETGAVKDVKDLGRAGFGAQVEDAFEPLHYGSFGGIATRILWVILGLAPGTLVITGTWLFLHKRKNKKSSASTS